MEATRNQHLEWSALDPHHQKWNALDGRAREAAAVLGYTQEEWDAGRVCHLFLNKQGWTDLDAPQKDAASLLGLNEAKWNQVAANVHEKHPTGLHEQDEQGDPEPNVLLSPFE